MVSQRCGPSPPIASAISRRMASTVATLSSRMPVGTEEPVGAELIDAQTEADDADRDRIGDRPVEIELPATRQEAVDGIQESVEAEQHQGAAVEGQHHGLDVPITELEAPVVGLAT